MGRSVHDMDHVRKLQQELESDCGREKNDKDKIKRGGGRRNRRKSVGKKEVKKGLYYLDGWPGVQKCRKSATIVRATIATLSVKHFIRVRARTGTGKSPTCN